MFLVVFNSFALNGGWDGATLEMGTVTLEGGLGVAPRGTLVFSGGCATLVHLMR